MSRDKDAAKDKDKAKPEGEADGEAAAKPKSRFGFLLTRKMLMLVGAPVALLLVAGSAYFFLFAGGEEVVAEGGAPGAHGSEHAGATEVHPVFFEVPDILVNVASSGGKPVFLKLAVSLELEGADETATSHLEPIMPRVVDQLQTYLRELRLEDLSGSSAMFRLKEELLRRVNLAAEPVKVKSVLFREMIIQ
ncbi:MAG: flagellar basal body-associated FliL family protein [Alphaproteobacteria bacterium]|nr:flagellar basal body-associated FliL family protein [Alphaproteobacteria bacterium]